MAVRETRNSLFNGWEEQNDTVPLLLEDDSRDLIQFAPSRYSQITKNTLKGGIAGTAAAGLIALRLLMTFSRPVNTIIMGGFGLAAQYSIQQIAPIANIEMHLLGDYSALLFLIPTQVILNTRPSRFGSEFVDGVLFTLFGMQTARLIDSLFKLTMKDDRTTESYDRERRAYLIHVLNGNTSKQRLIQETFKLTIAAAFLGYGFTHPSWSILKKAGWTVAGHAIGSVLYELAHMMRLQLERDPYSDSAGSHLENGLKKSVFRMRLYEKIAHIASIALPGYLLAFNLSYTDFLSGACLGIKRTIDLIRFTTLSGPEIEEIHRDDPETIKMRTTGRKIVDFLFNKLHFWHICVIGFAIWQGYIGTQNDRIVMGSLGSSFLLSYLLGRLVNLNEIDNRTHPVVNTLFFYLHYSLAAPLLFIAINQWMQIGDMALNTYNTSGVTFDAIAWGSLGWALGTHASEQAAGRKRAYPAPIDLVGLLFASVYWVQNVLPLFHFKARDI